MKRILLALDQEKWNKDAIDMACYLAKLSKAKVTGIFLRQHKESNFVDVSTVGDSERRKSNGHDEQLEALSLRLFRNACICREAMHAIQEGNTVTTNALINETKFADFMVIGPALSLKHKIELSPTAVVKDIVQHAHCPVVLVPESFKEISEVIFTYDGSRSAVYAMKQFTYLFPQLVNCNITVLEVTPEGQKEIVQEQKLMEWMNAHYSNVKYVIPSGNPADKLIKYLLPKHNAIIVMGAYGRNLLSRLFRTSTAGPVAGNVISPIFISHN